MEDKKLKCVDCGKEFIFTARDQEFYSEKGFTEPKRCKECRDAKKAAKNGNRNSGHFNHFNHTEEKAA